MPIESINPATGDLLRSFEPLAEGPLKAKIALAHDAFRAYAEIPLTHRALWMRKLAGILEDETDELAELVTREMGKTIVSARQEIRKCAAGCRYFADNAERILTEEPIPTESANSYVRWDPLGVVLAVMPWNFPFWQVFRFLAPALMAGNGALLKHAPNVPQCAMTIEALVRRAGFPRGLCQALLLETHQVESVLADERVAAVTLTGSEAAGRAVAAQAGWLIKRSVLELGGSDPFVVMPSADLDRAVATAVASRTLNNGQSCIAAKRFIIHDAVYEEFETRFIMAMDSLQVGDPMLEGTDIGPLSTPRQVETLELQIQAAVRAGGRILTGGERLVGKGNFFQPTVLTGVPRSAAVYRDEFFGPVAMLFRAMSLEDALEIANDTPFGLGASVWTNDAEEQQRLIAALECGQVFVNTMVASDPRLPFGGIKRSGYGRELSAAGMREFLNAKTVVIAAAVEPGESAFESHAEATAEKPGQELRTVGVPAAEAIHAEQPSLRTRAAYDPGEFSRAFRTALN